MRILWFTNTPSLVEKKFSNKLVEGGWIKSLEKFLNKKKDINLGIGFYHSKKLDSFFFNNTKYYPIFLILKVS